MTEQQVAGHVVKKDTKLSDLNLKPFLLIELAQRGLLRVSDLSNLTTAELLRIPGMGGADWRRIASSLDREPFPNAVQKRQSQKDARIRARARDVVDYAGV